MIITQWLCLWVRARGSWPCLSIYRPGCRVITEGRNRPLVFSVSSWKRTSHPTTSEPWMLGSICCVTCSLFLLPDYLPFHQLGCPGLSLPVLIWECAFTSGWAKQLWMALVAKWPFCRANLTQYLLCCHGVKGKSHWFSLTFLCKDRNQLGSP